MFIQFYLLFLSQSMLYIYVHKKISKFNLTFSHSLILSILFFIIELYSNQIILYITFIIVLYWFGYPFNQSQNKEFLYFCTIFSIFICSFFGYFFVTIGTSLYDHFLLNHIGGQASAISLNFLAIVFSFLLVELLLKLFKPNFDFLQKNIDVINKTFLLIINSIFTLCGLFLFTNYWYEGIISPNNLRDYMLLLFTTTIIALMSYLSNKIRQFEIHQKIQAQEEQEQSLITYIHQVENTYNEIKGFQHDYHNVLISLNESIQSNDLTRIKNTYQEILTNEKIDFKSGVHQLPKLANIKILPIKGIIAAKMNQAFADDHITIEVEITEPIEEVSIATLDYVRILSIFLDNALEEARQTKQPMISLAIFSTPGGGQQLIVENTCVEKRIDTIQLAEKGYSTKGLNRGIGLSNLETIIGSYDHLSLETSCDDHIFRQVIIFYH